MSTKRTSPRIACPARFHIPDFLVCTLERLDAGPPYKPCMFQPARWLFGVRTNFVRTEALGRRPPTAPVGRPKAGHPRRRRSRKFWNAGSALGNLGPAISVRNTDAGPATGEVHPDLDASAILSRAASIMSHLAASCDQSQNRPRAQAVFPHLRRYRWRRCAICCRCASGDSLTQAPALRFRNGCETVPLR